VRHADIAMYAAKSNPELHVVLCDNQRKLAA